MSSTNAPHEGHAPDSPSDVRALPARPNLEFERKQAKKLLAQIRRGNSDALTRVRARLKGTADRKPDEFKLADAQFTIAREYGFTSWPRLVEYFETLARHELSGARDRHHPQKNHEAWARTIMAEHRDRRAWTAQCLTAYVPRFYGRTLDWVFASDVTIEDAQLASARMNRYPSWEVMMADIQPYDAWTEQDTPLMKAMRALRAEDLEGLERLTVEYPELLSPAEQGHPRSDTLARNVLLHDVKTATPGSRRIYDWLLERVDLGTTLNWMLLGYMRMSTEDMQNLLDRGADPEWVPPNGYSVLEHVIWRCWNCDVVDLIARRVKPRQGFWISAGLGDAEAVRRYVHEDGSLTDEARQVRPDFTALGPMPVPQNPNPDDQEIVWEAFLTAAFNQRFAVLDVLLDRGFPIDYIAWGQTVLHLAVGNGWLPLVEYLVKRGADVNLRGWRPHASARELAEEHAMNPHNLPNAQRILELCGGRDLETLKSERELRRAKRVMPTAVHVEEAFQFAKQDAASKGLSAVGQENLFIGLLSQAGLTVGVLANAGVDLSRLRSAVRDRNDFLMVVVPAEMTANPEVSAILMDARTTAEQRKHEYLTPLHVLHALMQRASRPVLDLIRNAGGTPEGVLAKIELTLKDF